MGVRSRNSFPRAVPSSRVAFNFVRRTPGTSALTQTPCMAHSTARDLVREATADLLAPYAATSYSPTTEDSEQILMMRPYRRSIMCLPNTRHARKVPFRLVSRIACHSDSGKSSVGIFLVRPAQFTRMWMSPNSRLAAFRRSSKLALSVTSQVWANDCRPKASTSETALRTCSACRLEGTTLAPAVASALASASPMPLVPPITTAVLLLRSRRGWPIEFVQQS